MSHFSNFVAHRTTVVGASSREEREGEARELREGLRRKADLAYAEAQEAQSMLGAVRALQDDLHRRVTSLETKVEEMWKERSRLTELVDELHAENKLLAEALDETRTEVSDQAEAFHGYLLGKENLTKTPEQRLSEFTAE